MRLVTYRTTDGPAAAIQVGDTLVPARAVNAPASTVRGLLEVLDGKGLRELAARAENAEEGVPLAEATLCAPIPDAHKIICIGLNYRDHAEETGQEIPAAPMWFAKFANSLSGSGQPIVPTGRPLRVRRLRGGAGARYRSHRQERRLTGRAVLRRWRDALQRRECP